ncbi:MAG TPA: polyprenyl diphosphate synthase [Bacteriovoracaceae bacterium]|nr:polyprenyl diphosphate synthase [Bacteriovoracaceae bacterium]
MSSIKHVAIIMDGNGRWANKRFRPRVWGHIRGSYVVSEIVQAADDIGLRSLTLYAFSTENWSRPIEEVTTLFKILKKFLITEKQKILINNIKFKVIGQVETLPLETIELIKELELKTEFATGLNLTFAFNYGGRAEILTAVNAFTSAHPGQSMSEEDLDRRMYRPETGNVDLMIRTGGEQRISNFLLWQMAYAELYFTPTKWPEFSVSEFKKIINHVSGRERRFGNVCPQVSLDQSAVIAEANKSIFIQGATSNVQ